MPDVALGAISFNGGTGGIARVARLVAKVLVEDYLRGRLGLTLLSFNDRAPIKDFPAPVVQARGSKTRFTFASLLQARRCSHFLYDACHLPQVHQLPGLARRPYLTFLHGIEIWETAKSGYIRTAQRAHTLLVNSQFTLDRAERLHGRFPKARVCWLGTEMDDLPEAPAIGDGPPQVLIVARLEDERYKGHRELIACWPRVVAAVPDAMLRIVGQGPDREALQKLAAQSPTASRIVFEGFVSEATLQAHYANATVFCMPSRGEGFGLVYIEAMRQGLPVVASIHDAASEVVCDGQTGYVVNMDSPDELPERLVALLANRERARAMGLAGQRRWAEHFRFSAFRERFLPLLHEFLGQ